MNRVPVKMYFGSVCFSARSFSVPLPVTKTFLKIWWKLLDKKLKTKPETFNFKDNFKMIVYGPDTNLLHTIFSTKTDNFEDNFKMIVYGPDTNLHTIFSTKTHDNEISNFNFRVTSNKKS